MSRWYRRLACAETRRFDMAVHAGDAGVCERVAAAAEIGGQRLRHLEIGTDFAAAVAAGRRHRCGRGRILSGRSLAAACVGSG